MLRSHHPSQQRKARARPDQERYRSRGGDNGEVGGGVELRPDPEQADQEDGNKCNGNAASGSPEGGGEPTWLGRPRRFAVFRPSHPARLRRHRLDRSCR